MLDATFHTRTIVSMDDVASRPGPIQTAWKLASAPISLLSLIVAPSCEMDPSLPILYRAICIFCVMTMIASFCS